MKRQHYDSFNEHAQSAAAVKRLKNDGSSSLVQRSHLNFDFDKICTVTLSHINIYCCLTCGKYLQGRDRNSPAFLHSVNTYHQLYLSFHNLQLYSLPENKIVKAQYFNETLDSIRFAAFPVFKSSELLEYPKRCLDIAGNSYFNGFVPLTDSLGRDFCNVILMAIGHVIPLRDWLVTKCDRDANNEFVKFLSLVTRKQWNPSLFRVSVLTDELLGYLALNEPKLLTQHDPRSFLLHILHLMASQSSELKKLVNENIQGQLEICTNKDSVTITKKRVPFKCLTLDLPSESFFKSSSTKDTINQVQLGELFKKYYGKKEKIEGDVTKVLNLVTFPNYLILHFNRFDRSNKCPIKNRNKTLVEFPTKMMLGGIKYQLIANIIHNENKEAQTLANLAQDNESVWSVQLFNRKEMQWFEFSKNQFKSKQKQLLFLDETYMQFWEKDDAGTNRM